MPKQTTPLVHKTNDAKSSITLLHSLINNYRPLKNNTIKLHCAACIRTKATKLHFINVINDKCQNCNTYNKKISNNIGNQEIR